MIKANELRVGNWVFAQELYTGRKEIIEISTIWGESDHIILNPSILDGGLDLYYTSPEGIPLTPEIIKKFDDEQIRRCGNFFTIIRVNGLPYIGKIDNGVNVKYLHEFQNIFRDYAGEELEIKELQQA